MTRTVIAILLLAAPPLRGAGNLGVSDRVRIDPVQVEAAERSTLWDQYTQARTTGAEPVLPDFSHAGYRGGAEPIPTPDWTVFDVTTYGALPDDGRSDKSAIRAAIAAAQAHGSGIVFFPPGRFCINEPVSPWVNDPIQVRASRIVLRGSGRGAGGTELFAERHMDPSNPSQLWSCPKMIQFRGGGPRAETQSPVVADAQRETYSVQVADASAFSAGQWIQLTRSDPSPGAVAEAVAPYPVDALWTTLINEGVQVAEVHRVTAVDGNILTFNEPLHSTVAATGNWRVIRFDGLDHVGVEDLAMVGNWHGDFVHHASFYDDSGWSGLQFTHVVDSWIRNCRFTDWSACVSVAGSAAVTVSDVRLDGNKGHNALTFNNASHCLAAMIFDTAGHHHACGVAGACSGNVFWKCSYRADTCFESHASQPRCTLFDNITGGWMYGRWGGAKQNLPNHLQHLVLWNYTNIGSGEPGAFKFIRPASDYGRIILPYVVGFHGTPQAFDEAQVAALESNGTAVEPRSLYEAQYTLRTGRLFTELLYAEWAARYGLTGTDSALTADPDGDRSANLYEYGTGGTPVADDPAKDVDYRWVEANGFEGMEAVFRRRRLAGPLGLVYALEATDDLRAATWSGSGITTTRVVGVDDDWEAVATRTLPGSDVPVYLRLKVGLAN